MTELPVVTSEVATRSRRPALLNRHRERAALDGVLAGARAGAGGALVLRGESGTGKTALLDYAAESAADMIVIRLAGVESEMGLGFAALHRLLIPFLPRLTDLPQPQQDALRVVFGQALDTADGFLVGLAVLALLADAAGERALLIAVEDAQWLDEATTEVLAFVARRLGAGRIALVAAVRDPTVRCRSFDGLPDLYLAGLPDRCARELLARVVDGPVDERVVERIVAETGGNPLALVEFGRELTGCPQAGGTPPPHPLPISD